MLSFDNSFDEHPHYSVLREMFIQIFGVPNHHPKSQPFVDNVLNFSVLDNRIWFRNYQILDENGAIAEIGEFNFFSIDVGQFFNYFIRCNDINIVKFCFRSEICVTTDSYF